MITYIGSMTLCLLIILLIMCGSVCHGGKLLVFPGDGSHRVNMDILIKALHSQGHTITSSYYSSITMPVTDAMDEEFVKPIIKKRIDIERGTISVLNVIHLQMVHSIWCILTKKNKQLMQSIRETKYDLVLTDPANGGGVVLAHYLNVPLVFNVRWTIHGEGHFAIAPSPLSYVPIPVAELTDKMSFFERVLNFIVYVTRQYLYRQTMGPHYSALVSRYFGPEVDYFSLFQAADLWLMRVDFVFEFPRPTMPNVIYMGGFQCKPAKPLPQELEEFVQSSGEHGVIIMSLGTLIGQLPHDIADEIAAAFAQLPQKVIWRYKGDRPMPQNDLLGHPMTRLFVAHGGTNGIFEAIYHGVPIVGLPLVFDQPDNLSRMKVKGVVKVVDLATLDRNIFSQALQEVLNEPSYRTNMQRLSRLHRDVPMEPLDTALFWIEFVMRHKGAAHLRTESYRMPWYSYHSVDVMVFLLAVVLLILLTTVAIIRCLCFRMCSRQKIKHE
uniref:UDP glucuronosyltransferase 5 family, polypeptide F1 n=1 Tax=Hucho hucho TaxID=62062 RepID=A0A4W5REH4_9TELE